VCNLETLKTQKIIVDLKKPTVIPLPQFIQQDTNILEFEVLDDGAPADLTNINRIVVNFKRQDRKVFSRFLNAEENKISYTLGMEEMATAGVGEVELNFFNADNTERLSTRRFKVQISEQIGTREVTDPTAMSVLQELFVEVNDVKTNTSLAAEFAEEQASYAKEQGDYIEEKKPAIEKFTGEQTNLQAQVDQLVIDGDSSPEAAQARVDGDGNSYTTLKKRLDEKDAQVSAQLAENETQLTFKAEKTDVDATNLRVDQLVIGSGNANAEVDDAKVSTVKNKSFTTLRNRLEEIEGSTYYPIKNLNKNSNFDSSTDWAALNSVNAVTNNTLTSTGNGTASTPYTRQYIGTNLSGRKIYTKVRARATSPDCTSLSVRVFSDSGITFINQANPVQNQWYDLSGIVTIVGNVDTQFLLRHSYVDAATTNGKSAEWQKVLSIDLTATFGAGKEPTIPELEKILAKFPNGWFNGLTNLASANRSLVLLAKDLPIIDFRGNFTSENVEGALQELSENPLVSTNLVNRNSRYWKQGSIASDGTLTSGEANRIRLNSVDKIPLDGTNKRIYINHSTGVKIGIVGYDASGNYLKNYSWKTGELILDGNTSQILVIVAKADDTAIVPADLLKYNLYIGYTNYQKEGVSDKEIKDFIDGHQEGATNGGVESVCPLRLPSNVYKYIGHSGLTDFAPENTLEAYKLSKNLGIWGAETDIHMTSDGEVVLMHDATVDRMTNGTGNVANMTLAQIKALKIDKGANLSSFSYDIRVPTLKEFLQVCLEQSLVPVIEIKETEPNITGIIDKLMTTLEDFGMDDKAIVISFLLEHLIAVRQRSEKVWVSKISKSTIMDQVNLDFAESDEKFILFAYDITLTDAIANAYRSRGCPIIYGNANDTAEIEMAMRFGVEGIVTDTFYDDNRPSKKYSAKISTNDGGVAWIYSALNGHTVSFDTSNTTLLGVRFDKIPPAWLVALSPGIYASNINDDIFIRTYYNPTTKNIELSFYKNGVKTSLGGLLTNLSFNLNIVF
jgi:glycerophosphoryl diester phosphodiesterase